MGTRLVEYPLADGGTIVVSTDAPVPAGDVRDGSGLRGHGSGAVVEQVSETFESAVKRVQPAAAAVLDAVRSGPYPPLEVTVQFGLEMSAELGAIIATTGVQANFLVTLTWRGNPPVPDAA
ncbi:MAG: CU044_2847 family protein [Microbacterium sp.]